MTEPAASKYSSLRDGFAAIREMILVLAMLALLFTPTKVRSVLNDAGIRSFAGVEFDEETLDEVEEAGSRVAELEQQLALVQQQLGSMSQSSAVRADPKFGMVSKLLADAQLKAAATGKNLDEAKDKQLEIWNKSGRPKRSSHLGSQFDSGPAQIQQALIPPEILLTR